MAQIEPFRTTNIQLAFMLMCAGCTFASDMDDGPAVNLYTVGFLRQNRFKALFDSVKRIKGGKLDVEDAAKLLIDREIPGLVSYIFVRNEVWSEAMTAWDQFVDELQRADAEGGKPNIPKISTKVVAQVMCAAAQNQAIFRKVPFLNEKRQMVSTVTGETTSHPVKNKNGPGDAPAPRLSTTGNGKAWTIGAKEIRDYLNV